MIGVLTRARGRGCAGDCGVWIEDGLKIRADVVALYRVARTGNALLKLIDLVLIVGRLRGVDRRFGARLALVGGGRVFRGAMSELMVVVLSLDSLLRLSSSMVFAELALEVETSTPLALFVLRSGARAPYFDGTTLETSQVGATFGRFLSVGQSSGDDGIGGLRDVN